MYFLRVGCIATHRLKPDPARQIDPMRKFTDAFQVHCASSRNRPHVFPDHLEVSRLDVAEVCTDDEHVARVAEREVRLVLENFGLY